jgi:hypothetical protein
MEQRLLVRGLYRYCKQAHNNLFLDAIMTLPMLVQERRYLMDDLEHELDVAQTLLRRAQLEKDR